MAKRPPADEQVKCDLINENTLRTIMKRFLETKAGADERTKWAYAKDGLHFMATTLGCSVELLFSNKFAGKYEPLREPYYFRYDKSEKIISDQIYEYVEIKDGKKKKVMPTGQTIAFPDVEGLFNKYDPSKFRRVLITQDDINELIVVNEVIQKMAKLGGEYFCATLTQNKDVFTIGLHDCKANFSYDFKFPSDFANGKQFNYNPDYFISVLKTLKDLKVEKTVMYMNDTDPLLFFSKGTDYIYKLAFHRKLIR